MCNDIILLFNEHFGGCYPKKIKIISTADETKKSEINMIFNSTGIFYDTYSYQWRDCWKIKNFRIMFLWFKIDKYLVDIMPS